MSLERRMAEFQKHWEQKRKYTGNIRVSTHVTKKTWKHTEFNKERKVDKKQVRLLRSGQTNTLNKNKGRK